MSYFRNILSIYSGFVLIFYGHEIFHYICARIVGIKVYRLVLGVERISIKLKSVNLSPIPICGRIEIDYKQLEEKSLFKQFIIYLSGIAWNILCVIFFLIFIKRGIAIKFLIFVDLAIVVVNLMPFSSESDGMHILSLYK